MLFVSRLPLDAQAELLVSTLAERGAELDQNLAARICLSLAGREEKAAAKWLRGELGKQRIAVKHNHALRLIGKLAGREGWHGAPTTTAQYRLMLTGLDTPRGWDVTSSDPAQLLDMLCTALAGWTECVTAPRVAALRRGPQELLITQDPMTDEQGFVALFKTEQGTDWTAWYSFQNYAVKRVRRVLEEGRAPVFLEGAVLGMLGSGKTDGVRELTVFDGGVELGRGTELHVLELMEAEAGDELLSAKADGNAVTTQTHTFQIMETYRKLEPLLEISERTLLDPETDQLLRQYRVFRRKVGALKTLKLTGRYTAPDGIPQHVPVDWSVVRTRMDEHNMTPASVLEVSGSAELVDAIASKPTTVSLAAFVQLALALEMQDFNALVRAPRWSEANVVEEKKLRSILYAVDDVRFVVGRNFSAENDAQLREACEELHASRRVRQMRQSPALAEPFDDLVFAADGEEFLAVAERCRAEVRMQVTPLFIPTEGMNLPVKLTLPAVGRRLTLLMRPENVGEQRAQ